MLAVPRAASLSTRLSIVRHLVLSVETHRPVEFVDLTAAISAAVQGLTLLDGLVTVQTRHTTTGILVNEHEPLLLEDLEAMFERLAPASGAYAHDDLARRSVNLGPEERRNGHAHCRAALLRASESVPVSGGALTLGRWQRVFLVDFDGGQRRHVSLTLMGEARGAVS
jgi:secondary thiamine-phosphate synthase enzyme